MAKNGSLCDAAKLRAWGEPANSRAIRGLAPPPFPSGILAVLPFTEAPDRRSTGGFGLIAPTAAARARWLVVNATLRLVRALTHTGLALTRKGGERLRRPCVSAHHRRAKQYSGRRVAGLAPDHAENRWVLSPHVPASAGPGHYRIRERRWWHSTCWLARMISLHPPVTQTPPPGPPEPQPPLPPLEPPPPPPPTPHPGEPNLPTYEDEPPVDPVG